VQDLASVLPELEDSIRVLSLDADAQIAWVTPFYGPRMPDPEWGNCDELALNFDDWAGLVPQLLEIGALSTGAASAIEGLSRLLTAMSGQQNADLWTFTGLRHAPEWQAVRAQARMALDSLSKPTSS
jgi:hypothetical protein